MRFQLIFVQERGIVAADSCGSGVEIPGRLKAELSAKMPRGTITVGLRLKFEDYEHELK
jgi:hypothetical protein